MEGEDYDNCCMGLLFLCLFIENNLDRKRNADFLSFESFILLKQKLVGLEKKIYDKLLDTYFLALKKISSITDEECFYIHKDCVSTVAATQIQIEQDIDFEIKVKAGLKRVLQIIEKMN